MTEKRFKDKGFDNIKHYTETSMTEKEFEVVDDYDGDYFDLHKLSNIRSLINVVNYIINENKNMRLIIKRYNNENNELFDENKQLKEENQRLKHQVDIFVEFSERTIKILQGVKNNTQDNSYTSALMDSIAKELGVALMDSIANELGVDLND